MPTTDDTEAQAWEFACYEARQLTIALRNGDLDYSEIPFDNSGDRVHPDDIPADVLLGSLKQHPDEYLAHTCRTPAADPDDLRARLTAYYLELGADTLTPAD